MALVTTTVTPDQRLTPFTGISETAREHSGIARAEAVYSTYGTWAASGASDYRSISFQFSLDPDYGYILMDANAAFIKYDSQISMEGVGVMEIVTDLGPGASQKESQWYTYENKAARQNTTGSTPIGDIAARDFNTMHPITGTNSVMVFNLNDKPSALLYPFPSVNTIDVASMFGEHKVNQGAMAYRFYMRFLQYDIVQGYNYVVQSPFLTR